MILYIRDLTLCIRRLEYCRRSELLALLHHDAFTTSGAANGRTHGATLAKMTHVLRDRGGYIDVMRP